MDNTTTPTPPAPAPTPTLTQTLTADAEAVYHSAESAFQAALNVVAPEVTAAETAAVSLWQKLKGKLPAWAQSSKVAMVAFVAVAAVLIWSFEAYLVALVPDHVTHQEVKDTASTTVAKSAPSITDLANLKADVARAQQDAKSNADDVGQLKIELKAVEDKLAGASPITTGSVPPKKDVKHKPAHAPAPQSSGASSYLPSWAQ